MKGIAHNGEPSPTELCNVCQLIVLVLLPNSELLMVHSWYLHVVGRGSKHSVRYLASIKSVSSVFSVCHHNSTLVVLKHCKLHLL